MQKIFLEVNSLDKRCYEKFNLTEDILMENASNALALYIQKKFKREKTILILAGSGNNGADGIALARILHKDYRVKLYLPMGVKSKMAKLQLNRANLIGVEIVEKLDEIFKFDIIVESLFGSGLSRKISKNLENLLNKINSFKAFKIAVDMPTIPFKADKTITMGALKLDLFEDYKKDYLGNLSVANLGLSRKNYEIDSNFYLLEKKDLKLPFRLKKTTHKGEFGHLAVISGDKIGAQVISSLSALKFGTGLVTLISKKKKTIPFELMQSKTLPKNITAVAVGMGLGEEFKKREILSILKENIPIIVDADMFYKSYIISFLNRDNVVLTPHPKEFCNLLKLTKIADISVSTLQKNRFKYSLEFSKKYPKVTLLLKGANVIIVQNSKLYVNSFGISALSKAGSGDVLSGLIGAMLAQGYSPLESTINASLAHTLASLKFNKNSYALTPKDLIENISTL